MATFDKKDFQRFAVSTLGAIALSTACVVAAVGPVHAATPAPATVQDWQANVEKQVGAYMHHATALPLVEAGDAVVAVRFTADGNYAGARLTQSSGVSTYDAHALRVARHVAYPALPAAVRGAPQTVQMRLSYGDAPAQPARYAQTDHAGVILLAAK